MIYDVWNRRLIASALRRRLTRIGLVLLCSVPICVTVYADPDRVELTRAQWGHPVSGKDVTEIKPLHDMVKTLIDVPGATLVILYPDDDNGIKWAAQVVEWLVSLGVESARVQMLPATASTDIIELEVRTAGKQ